MNSEMLPPREEISKAALQVDLLSQLQTAEYQKQKLQEEYDLLHDRFQYVLKATQDAVWDWDLVKNTGWYSDGMKTLFGHEPNQPDAVKFWYDTIHPDDKERVEESIHAVIDKGGKNWQEHYRFKKADGSYAWVFDRGYAIHDSQGKPLRMVGSMQDVTREITAREALRESEEKFRGTFDQVAVGISIATPEGKFLSVNKAYPRIFGYTEEEFRTKSISDISHPDEIEGDRKIISDLLSGRTQVAARDKRYLHKSGRIVWGRVFGTVVYNTDGSPKYIVGVLEDITEQRKSLQTVQENEERLRLVIDSARIGTWDFDPRTSVLFWDDRCKELFGMAPEDPADYDIFLARVHPDDREAADKENRDAISGVGNGEYDLEYRTIGLRDSKIRWVRAKGRSYKDENGVTTRYAGTVIDITNEKEKEQQLREQEERFRLLATSIPQIVWTTDVHGIVDYMSDKWVAYTGHTPTYEKFSFRELIHPDDLGFIVPTWSECMRKGETFHGEYRLRNVNTNEYRWYSCTTAPLKDQDGKVIKWIGSASDVHDQKLNELDLESKVAERTKELNELNKQLEKSNAELEQYAYVTSHDLKEPLRKILMYNNMIGTKHATDLTPEVAAYLGRIDSAAARMSGLIDDLLKYSKLSNPVPSVDRVDLNTVIRNVTDEFEHSLQGKNISVEALDMPVIRAVPVQMHQLFFNLFSNAIKFSKPGVNSRITITCSVISEVEKNQNILLTASGRHFKIVFQDNGIGFAEKHNEHIFAIFQRLNGRQQYEGHGIGLALCRKIVLNHQGVITASGEENVGATFTIILPEGMG